MFYVFVFILAGTWSLSDAFCDGKPWIPNPDDGNCYFYDPQKTMTFSGAENSCKEMDGKAHLASIHSRKTFYFISSLIRAKYFDFFPNYNVWLGGVEEDGKWAWNDGSPFDYAVWTPGVEKVPYDSEDHIVMHFSRRYSKGPFDHATNWNKLTFVCMKPNEK